MKSLIIYFSRADENYAVGYIDKGNTEIVAEFVQELTGADISKTFRSRFISPTEAQIFRSVRR